MGCWGITALESDNGLDAVRCVRYNLPADGQLDLGEMLERLYSREREVDGTGKVTPQRVRLGNVPLLRRCVRLKAVEVVLRP